MILRNIKEIKLTSNLIETESCALNQLVPSAQRSREPAKTVCCAICDYWPFIRL